ncbi:MAG: uroporphyrinogen decarboxylase [Rickettsiaceae bacterium]|nr:uroporphyrinogen decarboxylase [Rickettsiaceae bacterium]
MKLFIDVLAKKSGNLTPPIWLMRQAGRYLPEYREVRKNAGSFLDLCYNPILASKVTLQPIERFDFDAAIIFSDILVVPHILGLNVEFVESEGPIVQKVSEDRDLALLSVKELDSSDKMKKVCEALLRTRADLDRSKALIGFAGAPWTVATYIISGRKNDSDYLRRFAISQKHLLRRLIEIIIEQTIIYLSAQIEAGAEVVQLFDSWAGVLSEDEYREFVIEPNKKIVNAIKKYYPDVPVIGFPRGSGILYEEYLASVQVNGLGVDYLLPLGTAAKLKSRVVVQGNLDPVVLLMNKDIIAKKVDSIMESLSSGDFVFNLGHGILKETPIENVSFLVDYVRNWKSN